VELGLATEPMLQQIRHGLFLIRKNIGGGFVSAMAQVGQIERFVLQQLLRL
jgi:hypothetical protein